MIAEQILVNLNIELIVYMIDGDDDVAMRSPPCADTAKIIHEGSKTVTEENHFFSVG